MTYCVGLLVDTGLVMLSDSRTNAGVDQINTFRKMATFQHAERAGAGAHVGRQSRHHPGGREPAARDPRGRRTRAREILRAPRTCSMRRAWWAMRCARSTTRDADHAQGARPRLQRHLHLWAARSAARSRGCSTSTRPATSSNPRSTRPIFRSASRSTASPSSTG